MRQILTLTLPAITQKDRQEAAEEPPSVRCRLVSILQRELCFWTLGPSEACQHLVRDSGRGRIYEWMQMFVSDHCLRSHDADRAMR
ncbi:MAG: hypothetical protein CMP09_01785 [Yangia sp.]|nr:hypothetical protein [Salipiger sp.]